MQLTTSALIVASIALSGCGGAIYTPRPSPRIQVIPDGNSVALVKNGRNYSVGFLGGEIEDAVRGVPRAEEEAHTYRSLGIASFVLQTLGGVSAGVGAGLLIYDESRSSGSDNGLAIASVTTLIAGLTFSLVGSVLASRAHPHLWNAVNLYNDALPVAPAWPPPQSYPIPYGATPYGYPGYPANTPPAAPIAPAPLVPPGTPPSAPPAPPPLTPPLMPQAPPAPPPIAPPTPPP